MAKFRFIIPALLVTAIVASCGDNAAEDTTVAPSSSSIAPSTTVGEGAETETGEIPVSETLEPAGAIDGGTVGRSYPEEEYPPELSGIIAIAVSDLASQLAVAEDTISVVIVEEVIWGDASLGCPEPDMSYAQVLTDGLRIVLEADGTLYDYRSGGSVEPRLCEQAVDKDDTRGGLYELTPDGQVIPVSSPGDSKEPAEGLNPPDK